jgi:hypothetical protein
VVSKCAALALALALEVFLFLFAPASRILAVQSGEFGLRFEFSPCAPWITEQLDTFSGVFSANLGGQPARTVTVPMSLTDTELTTIRRTVETIRFFDYPSTFTGIPAGTSEVTQITPAPRYRLKVRNGGVVHMVSWEDANRPSSAEADRLRGLLSMVRDFIHEHPEFKRLPSPNVGCM